MLVNNDGYTLSRLIVSLYRIQSHAIPPCLSVGDIYVQIRMYIFLCTQSYPLISESFLFFYSRVQNFICEETVQLVY